jgi:hypothetical protein
VQSIIDDLWEPIYREIDYVQRQPMPSDSMNCTPESRDVLVPAFCLGAHDEQSAHHGMGDGFRLTGRV